MPSTTTDRATLALAACEGLSDQELAERGAGGYLKMRDRKRDYADKFRTLAAAMPELKKQFQARDIQIAQLSAKVMELQNQITEMQQDAPITDTSAAAALLANLGKTGAPE